MDTEKSNGPFAFGHSNYVSANLIYLWSPSFRLGFEYLYGTNRFAIMHLTTGSS